jgi:hypothetical protein
VAPHTSEYCDCGHALDQHRSDGPCRARSRAYGYPCECRAFDDGRPAPTTDHTHQDTPWTPPAATPAPSQ